MASDQAADMSPAGGSNTVPPNTARAGPASKEGATLISVLRTGSVAGLHYCGVAMEPLPWRYSEKYAECQWSFRAARHTTSGRPGTP